MCCACVQGSELADEVVSLKNRLAEAEEEKGNLQLKLVDFEEMKALIGNFKKGLWDPFRQPLCTVVLHKSLWDRQCS